jgi:hypothetical protein
MKSIDDDIKIVHIVIAAIGRWYRPGTATVAPLIDCNNSDSFLQPADHVIPYVGIVTDTMEEHN